MVVLIVLSGIWMIFNLGVPYATAESGETAIVDVSWEVVAQRRHDDEQQFVCPVEHDGAACCWRGVEHELFADEWVLDGHSHGYREVHR